MKDKEEQLFTSLALTAVIAAFITPNVMDAEKSNQIFRDETFEELKKK